MSKTYRIDDPAPRPAPATTGNPVVWALVGGSAVMVVMAGVLYVALRGKNSPVASNATPTKVALVKSRAGANASVAAAAAPRSGLVIPQAAYPRPGAAAMARGFGGGPGVPPSSVPPPQAGFGGAPAAFSGSTRQAVVGGGFGTAPQPAPFTPAPPAPATGGPSPQDIIARVRGSVVLVLTETYDGMSSGTGFVVSSGQVATCEHVISEARTIYLFTVDGRRLTAAVATADARNDVAVLNVAGGLPPALGLGSYGQVREGDEVAVTGYPETFSMTAVGFRPSPTTTRGSISGKRDRMVDGMPISMLQTDTAVNHGNSGGPLYSLRDGTVYGIAAAGLRDTQGLNFAASVDALRRLLGR